MTYRLLDKFRSTFEGRRYLHRNSSIGDSIACELYEDLHTLGRSEKLGSRIRGRERVINSRNLTRGVKARRGDGTFGEVLPSVDAVVDAGFNVARGEIATVEIGTEVKILAKAMIKQIDRVTSDLSKQLEHFRKGGGNPICVGIVGINHAQIAAGYEGNREYVTDGRSHRHPFQEAIEAERRLLAIVAPKYDEFLVLKYKATNIEPYEFAWLDANATRLDYEAAMIRISRKYDSKF